MSGVIYAGQPGVADSVLYTKVTKEDGSFDGAEKISAAHVCNSTAGAVTLTVRIVRADGTAVRVYSALSVAAGATVVLSALIGHVLKNGDMIHGLASVAASLDVGVSGETIQQFTS